MCKQNMLSKQINCIETRSYHARQNSYIKKDMV